MEIKSTIHDHVAVRFNVCILFFVMLVAGRARAQQSTAYTVKNGKMYIEMSRQIRTSALDSFITAFDLSDLGLRQFFRNNNADSLQRLGWQVERNNKQGFVISKPLAAVDNIVNPADKIIFTEKHRSFAERFPPVNNGILYGYNRFRNQPFAVSDSVVIFFLRNNLKASRVRLAGSFNDWLPDALSMNKTDSGWIARVKLGPGKYWYKFIVDGNWMADPDNLIRENDGLGNINSVFFRPTKVFRLRAFEGARSVYLAGSFNNWRPRELQMKHTQSGWELPLYLPEGTHTYKFIVDGQWYADESNPSHLPDGTGGFNSVMVIGKPYRFLLRGFQNAKTVFLSGSFNNWRPDELQMKKTAGGWELPYVLGPGNYEYKFRVDGVWMQDPANPAAGKNNDNSFLIIDPNYTFRLKGYAEARNVFLAGDFNDWKPTALAMKRVGDEWIFSVHLAVGKHRYKFIVDNKWIIDPANKLWEQNEYGTGNSVIWIDK